MLCYITHIHTHIHTYYTHPSAAVVTGSSMADLYNGVKAVIRDRSGGPVWILTDDLLL